MKKLFMGLVIAVAILTGCGYNESGCYQSVQTKYPNTRIIQLPTEDYKFIVLVDSNKIRYIETMNEFNTDISLDVEIK